jgi:hypothetical protein
VVDTADEYILTGLLQFDWIKDFFDKIEASRTGNKTMGFEGSPNIVHLIKTQLQVKLLIEERYNVHFLSIDDDFELINNEFLSSNLNPSHHHQQQQRLLQNHRNLISVI